MSHVATIEIEIKDLEALGSACEALGLELVHGQKTYNWYGRSVGDSPLPAGFTVEELGKCEHAIRIKGTSMNGKVDHRMPYEIGIAKRRDGREGYALLWDTWNGGNGLVEKVGDTRAMGLVQGYSTEVAVRHMQRKGYRVVKREVKDGHIYITTQK